ncbi:hypothetical protein AKJ65_08340 [candidate division MSBL1 archaeon SCGC-AAA259E19]|uniref:Uncharacterized protein n=1 Tax=candidate division MSBL1 archaeon SCGC-AAA259E19 TaxID=1698264 RepID=A0A133UCC6_9EURY|nr:hypothetical protein AKJ65_08340 [candidate division MSBL1 archaeon SCGC-AAA259E19]
MTLLENDRGWLGLVVGVWAFGLVGFFGGFGGILSHLLGDLFTYQEFKPLWPFSNNKISFKWFSSKDRGK